MEFLITYYIGDELDRSEYHKWAGNLALANWLLSEVRKGNCVKMYEESLNPKMRIDINVPAAPASDGSESEAG